jgi:hypothetical protein
MLPEIIQPESLRIIEAYLECGSDVKETALMLGTTPDIISGHLTKRESRTYLDNLFASAGFRNREKMFDLLVSY